MLSGSYENHNVAKNAFNIIGTLAGSQNMHPLSTNMNSYEQFTHASEVPG